MPGHDYLRYTSKPCGNAGCDLWVMHSELLDCQLSIAMLPYS